jgi:hypothetical protein
MSAIKMDVIDGYLAAVREIDLAKRDFAYAREAQYAAVTLVDYMNDQFTITKAALAQAKLNAKPALKAYKQYCVDKDQS